MSETDAHQLKWAWKTARSTLHGKDLIIEVIYVSGLLACYRSHLDFTDQQRREIFSNLDRQKEIMEHLERIFLETPLEIVSNVLLGWLDLSPKLRQPVKTHFSFNGELSHGIVSTEVHEGV